jgi:hypothetical protein
VVFPVGICEGQVRNTSVFSYERKIITQLKADANHSSVKELVMERLQTVDSE